MLILMPSTCRKTTHISVIHANVSQTPFKRLTHCFEHISPSFPKLGSNSMFLADITAFTCQGENAQLEIPTHFLTVEILARSPQGSLGLEPGFIQKRALIFYCHHRYLVTPASTKTSRNQHLVKPLPFHLRDVPLLQIFLLSASPAS